MRRFYIPDWVPGRTRRWRKRHERFMASLSPEQKARLDKISEALRATHGMTAAEMQRRLERALSRPGYY